MYYEAGAYTLKLEMTSCPFGLAVNTNDESVIAASIVIKQDDMNANPLFTRAYRLYILFERVQVCVVEVRGSSVTRDLDFTISWTTATPPGLKALNLPAV
jgi:hypothetical protein